MLRKHIPGSEVLAGLTVSALLAVMLIWVATQWDNFNPSERDLPYDLLAKNPVEDRLYRQPLKSWHPPGIATAESAMGNVELGLFPATILREGWAIRSRLRRFDPDTLFEKINGEADKFLRQGFQAMHFIRLKSPDDGDEIAIELFDQGSFTGGLGIFSDHQSGDKKVERQGQAFYFRTPVGAIGFKGRYFFRIAGNEESEAIHRKTTALLAEFSTLPEKDESTPVPFVIFSRDFGIDPGRIAYQKSNVFQYDFAGDFWFARPDPQRLARLFLHQAPSPQAAAALFNEIAEEHSYDFKVLEHTENRVLMRHSFLKTIFTMGVEGSMLYGVENEPDVQRIVRLMNRYSDTLRHEG